MLYINERAEIRKSCEREIAELRNPVDHMHSVNGQVANGEASTSAQNSKVATNTMNTNLSTIDSPVFRTNLMSEPSIFSIEFRAFQLSMNQNRTVKLQLQGIQSLYDLATRLEDERDRVLERLQKLGLREDSFKILSITATTFR